MRVLRRRPSESIVFDGGLQITVHGLQDQRAWLRFVAPDMLQPVVLACLAIEDDSACIGVQAPTRIEGAGTALSLETADDNGLVLLANRRVGDALSFPHLRVVLDAVNVDRAVLGLELSCLAGRVSISTFPAAGGEVKIGIDAPRDVRVFREEVWNEVQAANTGAGVKWSPADLETLSAAQREH